MEERTSFPPLKLSRTVTRPAYQLWAAAVNTKTPPARALTRAALTALSWLRAKFRERDLPDELRAPEPDEAGDFPPEELHSLHLSEGFSIDVVSLPERRLWALRLLEPDLGFDSGAAAIPAVPGRMFETNIAFRLHSGRLECGFRVTVTAPEDCGVPFAVLRPTVVRRLADDPLIGLRHGYPLTRELLPLDTPAALRALADYLRTDGMALPAVVFVESAPPPPPPEQTPLDRTLTAPLGMARAPWRPPVRRPAEAEPSGRLPWDVAPLARAKMGYALFFRLGAALREECGRQLGLAPQPGDALLLPVRASGQPPRLFARADPLFRTADFPARLGRILEDELADGPASFGQVLFAREARLLEKKSARSADARLREAEARARERDAQWQARLERAEEQTRQAEERARRLQSAIGAHDAELAALRDAQAAELRRRDARERETEQELSYLRSLRDRPEKPELVAAWAARRFAGRLIFHPHAVDLMKAVTPDEVDLPQLCDALEYLACEYRDQKLGLITLDEMNARCAQKYHRPFEIAPVGTSTIEATPREYKIKYYPGALGKPVESALDFHLRVGTTPKNLLRIYFLFDGEKKLVVVGSLPKHLQALTIR